MVPGNRADYGNCTLQSTMFMAPQLTHIISLLRQWVVANLTKREKIRTYSDSLTEKAFTGTGAAILALLAARGGMHPVFGRWAGDRVALIGGHERTCMHPVLDCSSCCMHDVGHACDLRLLLQLDGAACCTIASC